MSSKQETFDIVVTHLRKQGCKSENDDYCLYRGPNGTMCAAGVLIPDGKYQEEFENQGIVEWEDSNYSQESASVVGKLIIELGHDLYLVNKLQKIHDCIPFGDWEEAFEELAKEHDLKYERA